jgi:hypothetical protein
MAEHVGQHGGTMSFSRPRLAGTGMIRTTLRLTVATVALGALAVLAGVATSARADGVGPINFESPAYSVGNINGQQGWSNTGGFDANVAPLSSFPAASGYGFGSQALQISDSVTSGTFGDQTFAPAVSVAADESTSQRFFTASFKIGTALSTEQTGLRLSVSPDNGSGGRMSYLRFEDQSDGVHVFFDDVTDSGPFYTQATFNETDIATLGRGTAHTIGFTLHLLPGAANDVVTVTIDGVLKATGTTWEDYYRYDNENSVDGGTPPPSVSTLLFREGGDAHTANAGKGFLIDNVSTTSSTTVPCYSTGLMRDGINMTAAQIGGPVTGTLNATGCNIGAYNPTSVSNANVHGANYYGVVVNHRMTSITNSSIHNIGEVPFDGTQHGNAVLYINGATGTISGNAVSSYQKNGISVSGKAADGVAPSAFTTSVTVKNNVVTGQGPVSYIAQNGIQMGYGAKGSVTGNTVTGNAYSGPNQASSGGILVVGGPCFGSGIAYTTGLTISSNNLTGNDVGVFLFNARASDCLAPVTKTNNSIKLNTIFNGAVTNTTGDGPTCGYQAGVSDLGHRDAIVNNKISGHGYTPQADDCNGTDHAFLRFIDTDSSARAVPSNK